MSFKGKEEVAVSEGERSLEPGGGEGEEWFRWSQELFGTEGPRERPFGLVAALSLDMSRYGSCFLDIDGVLRPTTSSREDCPLILTCDCEPR